MDFAWLITASLTLFIGKGIAQSVTKCGNSGPDSYYNSTTLPYVCMFVSIVRNGS